MMHPLKIRLLGSVLALAAVFAALPAMAEDKDQLARALAAAGARDWTAATEAAGRSGPMAVALIDWQRLRAGQGAWAEYRDFAARHGDWPGLKLLYQRGDALLRPDLPARDIIDWFGTRRPDSVTGAIAYIAALRQTDPQAAEAELARFWTNQPLTPAEQRRFLDQFGAELVPLHDARLAMMLDLGEWQAAQAMRPMGSPDAARLAGARIALQSGQAGVDRLILALPEHQRDDAGLALDRFRWRVKSKMGDLARDLMLERSTSAEALRLPMEWAGRRADYARAALRAQDWALAERLAAHHFLPQGSDTTFTDLEWLAGYAALRQGAADRALVHFQRLAANSTSPITLSRAYYWQARAAEAQGDAMATEIGYQRAAQHQTAYYGQLAAEHLRLPMSPDYAVTGPGAQTLPDWRGSALTENPVWQAGVWLLAAGDGEQAQRFFLHLAETASGEDIGRMARLMLEVKKPWYALRLAKAAAAKGAIYPAAYFPLTGLETTPLGLPPELVMSIARRESEFNHGVSSHAGALGLMQVMPDTARSMARKLGEPYDQPRLTQDAAYNARLGAAYLAGLRERFGTSIALTASGYNAGPGRPARWLDEFGDLRRSADPVEWVELIPFDETRNYVMRVAEALPIYRARISGRPAPLVPTYELTGGGLLPPPPQPPIRLAYSNRPPMSLRAVLGLASGGALAQVMGPPSVPQPPAQQAENEPPSAPPPSLAPETATR